jgi:anthranilate phosphoribosyltransferase
VLAGEPGPVRDIVVLNAAAGLVSFALAGDPAQQERNLSERLEEKITVASATLDSGAAARKLAEWVEATHA